MDSPTLSHAMRAVFAYGERAAQDRKAVKADKEKAAYEEKYIELAKAAGWTYHEECGHWHKEDTEAQYTNVVDLCIYEKLQ